MSKKQVEAVASGERISKRNKNARERTRAETIRYDSLMGKSAFCLDSNSKHILYHIYIEKNDA